MGKEGKHEEVIRLADRLMGDLTGHDLQLYTGNKYVNIALSRMAEEMAADGIGFVVYGLLPEKLPYDDLGIYNVVTNALRNAHEACWRQELTGEDLIHVEFHYNQNFLSIFVGNPVGEYKRERKQNDPWHGWGHRIILDVVDQYDGFFKAEENGGRYELTVFLQAPFCCREDYR